MVKEKKNPGRHLEFLLQRHSLNLLPLWKCHTGNERSAPCTISPLYTSLSLCLCRSFHFPGVSHVQLNINAFCGPTCFCRMKRKTSRMKCYQTTWRTQRWLFLFFSGFSLKCRREARKYSDERPPSVCSHTYISLFFSTFTFRSRAIKESNLWQSPTAAQGS